VGCEGLWLACLGDWRERESGETYQRQHLLRRLRCLDGRHGWVGIRIKRGAGWNGVGGAARVVVYEEGVARWELGV
jgi:hypothetical protein